MRKYAITFERFELFRGVVGIPLNISGLNAERVISQAVQDYILNIWEYSEIERKIEK